MDKRHAKELAIEMRHAGYSYNMIALRVGVSKGTLSAWLADLPYRPNDETILRIGKARAASGAAKSRLKIESFKKAREEAVLDIGALSNRDLFMLGLGLYIGEGIKSPMTVSIANSNPAIINLAIKWFIQCIGLKKEHIRLRIHTYPDTNIEQIITYWSASTKIPERQFLKTIIDRRKDKKMVKAGKLPYGTAHIRINSLGEKKFGVFLARKIMAWSDIVLSEPAKRD